MKRKAPFIFGGLGIVLIGTSFFLRQGTPDADAVITNLASVFMVVGGIICLVVAVITFFMRHHPEEW